MGKYQPLRIVCGNARRDAEDGVNGSQRARGSSSLLVINEMH